MLTLPGYQITSAVHTGARTVIYRGIKLPDRQSVIVKTLLSKYPTLEEITRLRHEYKILQPLNIEGISKPIALENYKNGLALILEDFGAESLKQLMASHKISVASFLYIVSQLAEILHQLYENHIIHKDIKPQNILIEPVNWTVRLIDFSIASRLSRETPTISNADSLEGTLAYISPEATGRMNRFLDYRCDFYSLGVTCYEILTGQLPFLTKDPLELIHCHVAVSPIPPHQVNAEIPQAVSDIVMKLMAKSAEDRYQTALGLKADIEICLDRLLRFDRIEYFTPGAVDKSGQFLIPQKLYGREAEVAMLLDAFDRVASPQENGVTASNTEIMLVSGYSGIGKTRVINEVHKPIVRQRGYFIAGKFDQFKRNIPYAALIQAFQELIATLLTNNLDKIAIWKEKLQEALGQNGQVIIDVIPEVERIIGPQPEVPELGATEAQNRFNRLFQKFIGVFAQPTHPLVLFLDDLQWADSASLKLIQQIVTDPESKYLLLIGAYRDNEVSPTHATIQTIEKIQQAGAIVNNIVLQPLNFGSISQLIADTLGETVAQGRTFTLAELTYNKTQGNPFFLTQLLQTLHAEKLINFDYVEGRWLWDIERIQSIGIADYSVVELVARNIQKLSPETQEVLKLAACIGHQFTLDNLAVVNEQSLLKTADDLWEALQSGLILPLSQAYKIPFFFEETEQLFLQVEDLKISYKFLHDRVQQAAYSLIPDEQKKETHLKIGKLLLEKTAKFGLQENIFDIVNQLNIGVDFITSVAEKEELAKLNLLAGRKALAATAYDAAVRYLNVGLQLLAPDCWDSQYELARDLFVETTAAEYLNTNFERAKQLSDVVIQQARDLIEKIPIYERKIQFHIAQNQMQSALDTALPVLQKLGVYLPKKASKISILVGLIGTKITLRGKEIEELANLPEMTDIYKLAAMRILMTVLGSVYFVAPNLFPVFIFKMIHLSIKYGNSPLTAYVYDFYGVLCVALGDIESAYKFGQLAMRLLEKFNAKELKSKVKVVFNNGIRHWKDHAKETLEPMLEGIQDGLEVGDIEHACYNAMNYSVQSFLVGNHLETLAQALKNYREMTGKFKQDLQLISISVCSQAVANLTGNAEEKCKLVGEMFNDKEMLPILIEKNNVLVIFYVHFFKTFLSYLFKDYAQAIEQARRAEKYAEGAPGTMAFAVHKCYYSLALLKQYSYATKTEQRQYLKQVTELQKKMKKWADHAPTNHKHKYLLVEAEKARVLVRDIKAMEYYELAIKGAKEQGYIQEEALANELTAEFYFSRGKEKIAQIYLTDAYYGYIRWGSSAKVKDLEERYPEFFLGLVKREDSDLDVNRTTTSTTGGKSSVLDLVTVAKASQAISEEIVLDKLLAKLMHITLENAGASKGLLFLSRADKLLLVAEGAVERQKVRVLSSIPVESSHDVPSSIINYAVRTGENLLLNNAAIEPRFANDPYIEKSQVKSVLCLPLIHQGKFTGVLYLENNLSVGAFTPARLSVLKLLAAQASISLEKASLYQELQNYSQQLEQSLHKLQQTQTQLIQTEKISSLGQLVAGVAHEVNNPVSFINGNLHYTNEYVQNLLNLLNLYRQCFPDPPDRIQEEIEAIDLEYLIEDLPKMLSSMKVGTDRIRDIMQSLRNFSRIDNGKPKLANIHEGLDSTLMILQHRLKAKGERPAINLVKEYGDLPLVECYSGQLNQVFMNLLANAIDALEEVWGQTHPQPLRVPQGEEKDSKIQNPEIRIRTEAIDGDRVAIKIKDNGPGMTEEVRAKLFDAFFTTKPEGKGTGLGLSISYQIVVEKHGGSIECFSTPGEGTEFAIEIPVRQESQNSEMGALPRSDDSD
ncbi:AAA family ATPase [Planktothrix sp. FACHB-1355]|uniref:histidine kinase n=1 Tax=Aerosakkonema funiforme FACHB-1375 TaxID=2949571 RepID=A0A926VFX6_9CYAN|nr:MULTISPECIES: ATP-binding sensor histidine kinase [Oscillatoriales]MBD2183160.1 AAA family ATPase [Aerosakkonema funiforme FACHB-1375]MBD3559838.1 AAA family ATPase [Planktothrix sp. FACHB-1355]